MNSYKSVFYTGTLVCLLFSTSLSIADDGLFPDEGLGLLLGIAGDYLLDDYADDIVRTDQQYRIRDRDHGYNAGRHSDRDYQHSRGPRRDSGRVRDRVHGGHSFTSPPIRGGKSRRTRIVENPYAGREVTGITLTGIDNDIVHIEDVISYPGRYRLSPLGYTLSVFHPQRYIGTGVFIDYISVQAKHREYFTVTFHYN
ncbi:MAG: hypothetical protein O2971_07110 [Proteobacteria bacterium]|nr:hypothetical protein [Pseudomonadota bacterium]